jgi:hypothetical protein
MKFIRPILTLLATALLLSACNSVPPKATDATPAPATTAPPSAQPAASKNLRKGMTEAEIRAVWGEPTAVHAGNVERETILVYNFDVLTTQRMVAATVNEWQTVDPVSGVPRTVIDPVLSPQQVTVFQSIVLQLIDGKLVSWARKLGEDRSFK